MYNRYIFSFWSIKKIITNILSICLGIGSGVSDIFRPFWIGYRVVTFNRKTPVDLYATNISSFRLWVYVHCLMKHEKSNSSPHLRYMETKSGLKSFMLTKSLSTYFLNTILIFTILRVFFKVYFFDYTNNKSVLDFPY